MYPWLVFVPDLIGRLTLKVREVIRSIEEDGWFQVAMHAE